MTLNPSSTAPAHDRIMARTIALAGPVRSASLEALRLAVVHGCAAALIAAGFLH